MSDSTFRSSDGQSGWPWTRRRRTRQLDTHVADGGFYRFHPPAQVQKGEKTLWQCSRGTTWFRLIPHHCTHLVVLEHSQLDLLPLVLVLLWSGVRLLLPLFSTTSKSEHQVKRRLLRCRRQVYIHEYIWHTLTKLETVPGTITFVLRSWKSDGKVNGDLQFRMPLWRDMLQELPRHAVKQPIREHTDRPNWPHTGHHRSHQPPFVPTLLYVQFQVQHHTHLLNVVIWECASILQLFPSKDQPLLVRRDTCRRGTPSALEHYYQTSILNTQIGTKITQSIELKGITRLIRNGAAAICSETSS